MTLQIANFHHLTSPSVSQAPSPPHFCSFPLSSPFSFPWCSDKDIDAWLGAELRENPELA